jgi:hypothetical protein
MTAKYLITLVNDFLFLGGPRGAWKKTFKKQTQKMP